MPETKIPGNRFDDETTHDPSQQHYDREFNDIVSNHDKEADASQEDKNIERLRASEKQAGSKPDDAKDSVRDAEDNPYDYPTKQSEKVSGGSSSKKKGVIGGSIAAAVIVGAFLGFSMLLPLKVSGIMSMVTGETMKRIEHLTEKRAKIILGRAILTKFGTHTGIVITGEGAFKTLVASMRTSGFEKRLANKGLVITQTPDGVRLTQNGKPLGGGGTLKNERAVLQALESNKVSNKVIKDIVREDIPSWRWMKKAKFAKWLRIKYGVPRYGLTNSDKSDPEEKKKEMDAERAKRAAKRTTSNFQGLITCILSGSCEAIDGTNEASKKEDAADDTVKDIEDAADESVKDVEKNGFGDRKEATKSISKLILGKFGSKAIPIIGWIDLVATLDHFAHEASENDYIGKISAYYKGAAYAAIYAEWSGYGSQVELGAMDPEYIGVLANELNDAEKAQAFQAVMGDSSKGVPIETLVNSDKPSTAFEIYKSIYNGPQNFQNKYIGHPILNAYYETVGGGGFLGWAADGLGDLLGSVLSPITGIIGDLTPDSVKDLALETVSALGPWILKTFGLTIDEFETGPELMNNIFGGGVVSSNDYCKEIGCRKLSSEQAYEQNMTLAVERAKTIKEKGVLYSLFSAEEPKSLTNQLAYTMPASVEGGVSSIASSVLSIPSRLASLATPQSQADTAGSYEQLYGVAMYGATENDLNQPLSQEVANGDACGEVDEDKYNGCTVDLEVTEAMLCDFEPDSADCSENDPSTTGTGEAIEFTVGSYNILHSDHHAQKSRDIGGCTRNPVPGDPNCAKTRAALQVKVIKGEVANIPALDIFGAQEVSPDQYRILKEMLPNYAAFPKDSSRIHNQKDGATALYWNTEKFTEVASGKFDSYSNVLNGSGDGRITSPWVGLQASNGQKVYITSVHYATDQFGGTPQKMRASAQSAVDWVKTVVEDNSIVLVVGDMNDKLSEKLTYCVFTKNGILQHARDMMNGLSPDRECPAPNNVGASIDHIYTTPTQGLSVTKWADPPKTLDPILPRASDHTPVYAKFSVAGASKGSLNIATFNILHVGDSDFEKQWRTRMQTSIGVLKQNNISVAGLQEVRPDQHDLLTSQSYSTDTYDIFPKTSQRPNFSPNPIIWNKSMFKLKSGKTLPIEYDNGNKIDHAVQVLLEDNAGNQFYVLNTHDPANARPGSDEQNALSRLNNAKYYKQHLGDLAGQGKPIFLTGDFNSSYTMGGGQAPYNNLAQNLTYCVISSSNALKNVWDIFENKQPTCPRNKVPGDAPIDHIYAGNIDGVKRVWTAAKRTNGSDHPTVMAAIDVPWADEGGGANAAAWSWPVAASAWKSDGQRWLASHTTMSDAWTNDIKAASDINIGSGNADCGKPIYSMLGGKIVANPPTYTMQVSSTLNGKKVIITYAHGSNMKQSGTVSSGQQIMTMNNSSRYSGITCHLHLEISYDGKPICPQDIFPLIAGKKPIDLSKVPRATYACG